MVPSERLKSLVLHKLLAAVSQEALVCRFAPLNKVKLNTLLANITDAEDLLAKGK